MNYVPRRLQSQIFYHLGRGKSILLLGPRQTGKSTLLQTLSSDLTLSFVQPAIRQRYEKNPSQLTGEIEYLKKEMNGKTPLVFLDEIQKVPTTLDVVQDLVDRKVAQFILTGSSARKLRRGHSINLLPGRLVTLHLDPLSWDEISSALPHIPLEQLLHYGSLPGILLEKKLQDREIDLQSYVESYLEEEVRAEAIVRNVGTFARFLEYAALESGRLVSFRALSQELGVAHTTISSFYEILEDCLIVERVQPLTRNATRKKLTKSSRYLFFDLGVRRLSAREGTRVTPERMGEIFEQFVGLELIRQSRLSPSKCEVLFWRDPDGPDIDWLLNQEGTLTPIEVKWTDKPNLHDAKYLEVFLKEYSEATKGYVICRVERPIILSPRITALPWQKIPELFSGH